MASCGGEGVVLGVGEQEVGVERIGEGLNGEAGLGHGGERREGLIELGEVELPGEGKGKEREPGEGWVADGGEWQPVGAGVFLYQGFGDEQACVLLGVGGGEEAVQEGDGL